MAGYRTNTPEGLAAFRTAIAAYPQDKRRKMILNYRIGEGNPTWDERVNLWTTQQEPLVAFLAKHGEELPSRPGIGSVCLYIEGLPTLYEDLLNHPEVLNPITSITDYQRYRINI